MTAAQIAATIRAAFSSAANAPIHVVAARSPRYTL